MASLKCGVSGCKRDFDTVCAHCQSNVCSKHYIEHVKLANDELIPLADRLNFIVNSIQQSDPVHKAFQQIEEWRQMNYRRIDKLCDEKKRQLKAEIEQNVELQMKTLRKLSQQVKELIDEGDASFKQIENLKRDVHECHKEFQNGDCVRLDLKTIEIETVSINTVLFNGGVTLLSLERQIKLNEFYGQEGQKWMLIYKATRDGFTSTAFHKYCDNQGPTMTIIQSKPGRYLFGGYTSASWSSMKGYAEDRYSPFLFTLTNPHGIPPTKYPVLKAEYSIFNTRECGPIFGGGHDLYVCDESQGKAGSFFNFPWSFNDRTNRGSETFTGNKYFQTSDIEVYRLVELF
jgi:hypothetical protein